MNPYFTIQTIQDILEHNKPESLPFKTGDVLDVVILENKSPGVLKVFFSGLILEASSNIPLLPGQTIKAKIEQIQPKTILQFIPPKTTPPPTDTALQNNQNGRAFLIKQNINPSPTNLLIADELNKAGIPLKKDVLDGAVQFAKKHQLSDLQSIRNMAQQIAYKMPLSIPSTQSFSADIPSLKTPIPETPLPRNSLEYQTWQRQVQTVVNTLKSSGNLPTSIQIVPVQSTQISNSDFLPPLPGEAILTAQNSISANTLKQQILPHAEMMYYPESVIFKQHISKSFKPALFQQSFHDHSLLLQKTLSAALDFPPKSHGNFLVHEVNELIKNQNSILSQLLRDGAKTAPSVDPAQLLESIKRADKIFHFIHSAKTPDNISSPYTEWHSKFKMLFESPSGNETTHQHKQMQEQSSQKFIPSFKEITRQLDVQLPKNPSIALTENAEIFSQTLKSTLDNITQRQLIMNIAADVPATKSVLSEIMIGHENQTHSIPIEFKETTLNDENNAKNNSTPTKHFEVLFSLELSELGFFNIHVSDIQKNIFIHIGTDNEAHRQIFDNELPDLKLKLSHLPLNNVSVSLQATKKQNLHDLHAKDINPSAVSPDDGHLNILA